MNCTMKRVYEQYYERVTSLKILTALQSTLTHTLVFAHKRICEWRQIFAIFVVVFLWTKFATMKGRKAMAKESMRLIIDSTYLGLT